MKKDKKRKVVARVLGADNKTAAIMAEAKREGVHPRTVERWIEGTEADVPAVRQNAVSENAAPPENGSENPVLDTLLKDEAGGDGAAKGPITSAEKAAAAVDTAKFCVDAYSEMKSAAGSLLVQWKFAPPLNASSPEVAELFKIGVMVDMALRMNAPMLYPIIAKNMGGWSKLLGLVAADAFGMILAIQGLAKSKGWKPEARKATDKPAPAEVPTQQQYGEQLRAAPPATSTAAAAVADVVVNAPLPTPEQVAMASAVREVLR